MSTNQRVIVDADLTHANRVPINEMLKRLTEAGQTKAGSEASDPESEIVILDQIVNEDALEDQEMMMVTHILRTKQLAPRPLVESRATDIPPEDDGPLVGPDTEIPEEQMPPPTNPKKAVITQPGTVPPAPEPDVEPSTDPPSEVSGTVETGVTVPAPPVRKKKAGGEAKAKPAGKGIPVSRKLTDPPAIAAPSLEEDVTPAPAQARAVTPTRTEDQAAEEESAPTATYKRSDGQAPSLATNSPPVRTLDPYEEAGFRHTSTDPEDEVSDDEVPRSLWKGILTGAALGALILLMGAGVVALLVVFAVPIQEHLETWAQALRTSQVVSTPQPARVDTDVTPVAVVTPPAAEVPPVAAPPSTPRAEPVPEQAPDNSGPTVVIKDWYPTADDQGCVIATFYGLDFTVAGVEHIAICGKNISVDEDPTGPCPFKDGQERLCVKDFVEGMRSQTTADIQDFPLYDVMVYCRTSIGHQDGQVPCKRK